MQKFLFLSLFIYFNCTNPFEIKVIKEADAPDFLLSEIECNRSGLRIPLIEELVLADIFGALNSMRENAKKYHSKIVLSSSYEGALDFHLAYDLDKSETYIFRNTIPVGIGYCIDKEKTFFYKLAVYSNRLILWLNQYLRHYKYIYIGEGSFREAELLCHKFSQAGERSILPETSLLDFKSSDTYEFLNRIGKSSFWI